MANPSRPEPRILQPHLCVGVVFGHRVQWGLRLECPRTALVLGFHPGCDILNTRMNLSRSAVLAIALLAPLAAFAQDTSELASRIEAVPYNPLAKQARIQGDVRLRSGPDGVIVI